MKTLFVLFCFVAVAGCASESTTMANGNDADIIGQSQVLYDSSNQPITVHPFVAACVAGDTERVQKMIRSNPKWVEMQVYGGKTPLHFAAEYDKDEIVKLLLKNGANVNAYDMLSTTPLMTAAISGSNKTVKVLIAAGADKDAYGGPGGATALSFAVTHRHLETVRVMLECGVNPNAKDYQYWGSGTPLEDAVMMQNLPIVKLLLEHGTDPNMTGYKSRSWGPLSGLMGMDGKDSIEMIRLLLEHGANPNTLDPKDGSTDLHYCAKNNRMEQAKLLLEHGANVNAKANNGETPLQWATTPEMKKLLLEHGAK